MEQNKNGNQVQENGGGEGRTHKKAPIGNENEQSGNEQNAETADISAIDQQEGTMHNGELGGNFRPSQPGSESGS